MRYMAAVLALLTIVLCASCGIDFQTRAVEKARAYALDNMRQLDETQRDFIRYTDPVIMENTIYRMSKKGEKGENPGDMLHTCMVWNVPGVSGSVVVAGHGERSLLEWNPDRIVIEDMKAPDAVQALAVKNAVIFVMSNMLHLSDAERNHIRFLPPEIYQTKFEIEPEGSKDAEKPLSRWEAYLKSKEKKAQPVQYTVAWKGLEAGSYIAVCGFSPKKSLASWKPKEGRKILSSELEAVKLSTNLAPEWPRKEEKAKDSKNAAPAAK